MGERISAASHDLKAGGPVSLGGRICRSRAAIRSDTNALVQSEVQTGWQLSTHNRRVSRSLLIGRVATSCSLVPARPPVGKDSRIGRSVSTTPILKPAACFGNVNLHVWWKSINLIFTLR